MDADDIERVYETRRNRAQQYIDEHCEGRKAEFARRIQQPPDYVWRMLSTGRHKKNIGEAMAREIERLLKLPALWLDRPTAVSGSGEPAQGKDEVEESVMGVSRETLELALALEEIRGPKREAIVTMIMSIADEERAGREMRDGDRRSAKASRPTTKPRHN